MTPTVVAGVILVLVTVVLMWLFREEMGLRESELDVLFSGLAFAAVAATLLVQLGELKSQRKASDETLRQLTSQTAALQDQLLSAVLEARIAAFEKAIEGVRYRLGGEDLTGTSALEHLFARGHDPDKLIARALNDAKLDGWWLYERRKKGLESLRKELGGDPTGEADVPAVAEETPAGAAKVGRLHKEVGSRGSLGTRAALLVRLDEAMAVIPANQPQADSERLESHSGETQPAIAARSPREDSESDG